MKNHLLSIILLFTLSPILLLAQTVENPPSKKDIINNVKILMDHCNSHQIFNGNIMVTHYGEPIYTKSIGFADNSGDNDIDEKLIKEKLKGNHIIFGRPLDVDTKFYLASVSKQFTAMAIMILKGKNKLSYNDKLSKFFPDFPEYADKITIRHLLTHTSGIADHYRLGAYKPGLSNSDVYNLLVKQEKLDFEPGDQFSYSNGGYVLLSMIVSKVSNRAFADFMFSEVFKPLGMRNTLVYTKDTEKLTNRAIGYNSAGELDDYTIYTTGAGGIYSNLTDLHIWDQALYEPKLVSSVTLDEAFYPMKLNDGTYTDYGFGWGIEEKDGVKSVSHSGGLAGFRTFIKRNIYENSGYIILTNFGDKTDIGAISKALDHIFKNEDFDLPKIKISTKFSELLKTNILAKAYDQAKSMVLSKPKLFEVDEQGINALGYKYLGDKDYETAIGIFEFNVEFNPNSSNVYDSLGEAQLASGETRKATKNYIESYLLNRNNKNAIEVLKKTGMDVSDLIKEEIVDVAVLESYVGSYQLEGESMVLEITRRGTQLFILPSGQSESEIFCSFNNRFYSKIVNAQISFNKGAGGIVDSITLHQNGDHRGNRIK